jgi:dTDP-4-dehydrorhamnose 3,5-epimerase
MFTFTKTPIDGVVLIKTEKFEDDRGFFTERFKFSELVDNWNNGKIIEYPKFSQDNFSRSHKNVIRGLHYQIAPKAQTKLVSCLQGKVWDVAVDIRKDSPTYGQSYGAVLDEYTMLYIDGDLAHGFSALTDNALVYYKCSEEYNKKFERSIRYDDPFFNVDWRIEKCDEIVSEKDMVAENWHK